MTVSSTQNRVQTAGNGVTTSFSTSPVIFFDTDELDVYVTVTATGVSTLLTENTDYTVTGGAGLVGTVDLAGGATPYGAPAVGTTVVVVRTLDVVQEANPVNNDDSDAEVIEQALDKGILISQQLAALTARSMKLADSDVSGASVNLPTPTALQLLGWDADALNIINYDPSAVDTALTTAYTLTLLAAANAAAARSTLGLSDATTKGDILGASAAGAFTRLAVGANGSVLTADSTASKGIAWSVVPLPRSYLAGFGISNNGSDATNDIDFAAGAARDSTNTSNLVGSALTKQLDVAWAAGNNQGGRLSAAAIANTTYHCYAILKDSDQSVDYGFDVSATAPTMPSGYTKFRRIGSIVRAGATIPAFSQNGDEFLLSTSVLDVDVTAPGTSAVTRTLASVPTGVKMVALFNAALAHVSTDNQVYFSSLDQSDQAPSLTAAPLHNLGIAGAASVSSLSGSYRIRTNTSAQIRSRNLLSGASDTLKISTVGWLDDRGRNA